jgi:hypothetical protein
MSSEIIQTTLWLEYLCGLHISQHYRLDWRMAHGFISVESSSEQDLVDYIDFLVAVIFGNEEPPGTTGWYSMTWTGAP